MTEEAQVKAEWWKTAVIYQIYPRSFQDSNGDGLGDLNGIRRRLPYLAGLGVDAVWVSPFYKSPMADFGYDVSDYYEVDPLFGTLADCKSLIAEAHALGLKVMLDFVPNHTSDQHPWFIESRSSRQSPKRDWYIWKDASPGGGPPNNWVRHFGGIAWDWDEASGQYYYHAYLKEQPHLNWRDRAITDYSHAIKLRPDSYGYEARASAFLELGKAEAGLPDANKAITLDAKNPFAFNTRAQIYEALGRKQAAIADFRKVLKLKPGMQDAIEGLKRLGAEP